MGVQLFTSVNITNSYTYTYQYKFKYERVAHDLKQRWEDYKGCDGQFDGPNQQPKQMQLDRVGKWLAKLWHTELAEANVRRQPHKSPLRPKLDHRLIVEGAWY